MLVYIIRRVASSIVVLFAASIMVFGMATWAFDPTAQFRTQPNISPAAIEAFKEKLGLNDPVPVRYWNWLTGAIQGDFGQTVQGSDITPVILDRSLVTLRMVGGAVILALVLSIVVGVLTAVRRHKLSDYFFTTLSYIFISLPVFWFAALLKEFVAIQFNELIGEQWLFTQAAESPGISLGGTPSSEVWLDRLQHLVLPTIALTGLTFAAWSRYQRSAMLDVLGSDFMRMARAKGLPWRTVLFRHGVRNALIPLTTIVALGMSALLSGAVVTETVFNWHAMGTYLTQEGLRDQDVNVMMAWMMLVAVFIIALNLIADLLYAVLDPRIRL